MAWWEEILRALWVFLPAYVANMSPVFVAKLIPKWKAPIDGGRLGKDGHPLLGKSKTWRGLVGGAVTGGLMALLMVWIAPHWGIMNGWDFGAGGYIGPPVGRPLPSCHADVFTNQTAYAIPAQCAGISKTNSLQVFLFGFIVGGMALVGDFVKSYFKRRRNIKSGGPWFPFDQLDFVVFGLLGMLIAAPLLPSGWVWHALTDSPWTLATLLILTPALHLLVNRVGYWLGLKEVPW